MKCPTVIFVALWVLFTSNICTAAGGHEHTHSEEHHSSNSSQVEKGPHGGRLLQSGNLSVEVTIYEKDSPPQFRIYAYESHRPLDPGDISITVHLKRFPDTAEIFEFTPEKNYLFSEKIVSEPHSFNVTIEAHFRGQNYTWQYESYEGRTTFSKEALAIAKLDYDTISPRLIRATANIYGRLFLPQSNKATLRPRFSGLLKDLRKGLGDKVDKGEILAVVESNQSLQPYELRSPIKGEIIAIGATPGEYLEEGNSVFEIANLETISGEFRVLSTEATTVRKGQKLLLTPDSSEPIQSTVDYVSPLMEQATQASIFRTTLPNPERKLHPGMLIKGKLILSEREVSLAVTNESIQTFRDWDVIYLSDGKTFQATPVELGERDFQYVELLSGAKTGDRYVSHNSYVIKADIEKSAASHDH